MDMQIFQNLKKEIILKPETFIILSISDKRHPA